MQLRWKIDFEDLDIILILQYKNNYTNLVNYFYVHKVLSKKITHSLSKLQNPMYITYNCYIHGVLS